MKRLIAAALLLFTLAVQAETAPDRQCIDQALFVRSVRVAMINGQKEDDVTKRVDIVRQSFSMPDEEWAMMKTWIHVVYASSTLSDKTPEELYDYAIQTCTKRIDS